ncbi:MAG: FdtA/QdtA family cupin domain-containing protein [Muribaculaceae bacterium]|nr:FdtA/QdtA family cupin domain-containing protein [Muribaculaceae bacterium]
MPRNETEIIRIARVEDPRGNLSFVQNGGPGLPFGIRRAYWIYDVPGGRDRHGHAFRSSHELIVALSGSFDVVATAPDGTTTRHHLCRSYYGLYVPPMTWRALDNFSTNSVALVLSSTAYNPGDYIEDFDIFSAEAAVADTTDSSPGTPPKPQDCQRIAGTAPDGDNPFADSSVDRCALLDLPRIVHPNGSLTFQQNDGAQLPFDIRRVYYLYDIPGDSSRGGHAHRRNSSLIVAASGSFEVTLNDGARSRTFMLNRPYRGLYVPPGLWREIGNFSSGAVCLVLTSELFSEDDYVRSRDQFLDLTASKRQ